MPWGITRKSSSFTPKARHYSKDQVQAFELGLNDVELFFTSMVYKFISDYLRTSILVI